MPSDHEPDLRRGNRVEPILRFGHAADAQPNSAVPARLTEQIWIEGDTEVCRGTWTKEAGKRIALEASTAD